MSKMKSKSNGKKATEDVKAIAVISAGDILMIQPNFDVPAGSVLQVNPRQSGVQIVGGERAEPSKATTPAA